MLVRFREERRDTTDVVEAVHRIVAAPDRLCLSRLTGGEPGRTAGLPEYLPAQHGSGGGRGGRRRHARRADAAPAPLTRFGGKIAPAKVRAKGEEGRLFARSGSLRGPPARGCPGRRRPGLLCWRCPSPACGSTSATHGSPEEHRGPAAVRRRRRALPTGHRGVAGHLVLRPGTDAATADRIRALTPGTGSRDLSGGTTVLELPWPAPSTAGPPPNWSNGYGRPTRRRPVQVTGTASAGRLRQMLADRAP